MRTSDELDLQHKCSNYRNDIPLSNYNPMKIYKACQEELLDRLLRGEEIPDVAQELNYLLTMRGYQFEDSIQRDFKLYLASRDINRYVNSEHRPLHFIEEEEQVVVFRGEQIRALGTYYCVDDTTHTVTLVKVKADTPNLKLTDETGKTIASDEREQDEAYALMLLARKIRDAHFPGYRVELEFNHLADEYKKPARGEARAPYIEDFFDEEHSSNTIKVEDGAYYDAFFEQKWAIDDRFPPTCGGAACSGCGCYTACHYTEPPLVNDLSNAMKNPDDVQLSYAQRQVVNHNSGSILVDSGAGAGKTTCITMRILKLLRDGVDPSKILLLTFTNAAAQEMLDRVAMYIRSVQSDPEKAGQLPPDLDSNDILGCTFNGLCQRIIDEHYEELGFNRAPMVIPADVEQKMIHDVFDLYPEKIPGWSYYNSSKSIYDRSTGGKFGAKPAATEFLNLVEKIKNLPEGEYRWQPIEDLNLDHKYVVQLKMMIEDFEAAHTEYINGLSSSGRAYITYQDQFLLVEKLLSMHPTLWDEYGYEHIIVDEVQDSNPTQLKLLEHIQNNASYKSLCSVGDMQQSIYGFNGAVPENMLQNNYEGFFGPTQYTSIRENFRCSREVIGFVNTTIDTIIENTARKGLPVAEHEYEHLVGTRGSKHPVDVQGYYSQESQMKDIARQIKEDIESGIMPGDIMFITRNKFQLTMIASELTKIGVPSVLRCPVPYMDNSNVGAALAFMDSYLYGYEEGFFDYCNQLSKGTLFAEADAETIEQQVTAFTEEVTSRERSTDSLKAYLAGLDPDKKDECYQDFLQGFQHASTMQELEDKLIAFKQHGATATFKRNATYGEVQLSTIHSAKGLESKVIYCDISKLDDPQFHEPRLNHKVGKEYKETNRLEYVAYTRAKDKLVVTAPYVLRDNNGRPMLNKRLINAYKAIGKTYGYNFMAYMQEKANRKAQLHELEMEELQEEAAEIVRPTLDDVYRRYHLGNTGSSEYSLDDLPEMEYAAPVEPGFFMGVPEADIPSGIDQVSLQESVEALGLDFQDFNGRLNPNQHAPTEGVIAAFNREVRELRQEESREMEELIS